MNLQRLRINIFALAARLPTMLPQREYLEAGLISYGPNLLDMNRRAADYVDKILRGAKPADLPVEQPVANRPAVCVDLKRSGMAATYCVTW
jgi:putative ABC transport system substrate-binding protein